MRALTILLVTTAIFFAAMIGCGKVTSDQNPSDAGSSNNANELDGAIKPLSGQIIIDQPSPDRPLQQGVIDVSFTMTSPSACKIITAATCTLTDCSDVPFTGFPQGYSAGPISVSGGHLAATLMVQYNVGLQNYSAMLPASAVQTGDQFEIEAPGADLVDDFQGMSAKVPANIVLTSPVAPDGGSFVLDESQDLLVTWTGASEGSTTEVMVGTGGAPGQKQIVCAFPGTSGSGTVPSSLLESFGAPASDGAELRVQPQGITTLPNDDTSITVIVEASGDFVGLTSP